MKMNNPFTAIDVALHSLLLEAIHHYATECLLLGCECEICQAAGKLEQVVGEEDFMAYMHIAEERIKEATYVWEIPT